MTDYVAVRPAYIGYKEDGSKCVLDDDTGDAITPILVVDANGPVGVQSISRAWANLPTPSAALAGTQIWCPDFPGPQNGALLYCTGTRWTPVSQQHCLMNYANGATGLVVAAGAAEALFGVARLIKGGMILPKDRLRLVFEIQQAAVSSAGARTIRVRSDATEAGLLTGSQAHIYQSIATSPLSHAGDKNGVVLTNTTGKSGPTSVLTASSSANGLSSTAFSDLSADSYMQFTIANASDQAMTVYSATLFVEFGS